MEIRNPDKSGLFIERSCKTARFPRTEPEVIAFGHTSEQAIN